MSLPTKLYHYSGSPIESLHDSFYVGHRLGWPEEGSMKPVGLWISVKEGEDKDSWFDWCVAEQFRLENLKHKYLIKLAKDAKILHLKTSEEIRYFSLEFCANDPGCNNRKAIYSRSSDFVYSINWKKIKEKYDGIIISPYQWQCRLESLTSWYYPWDCASGCIWNLEKVSLELESIIDTTLLLERECLEEESSKDSQSECPVPSA